MKRFFTLIVGGLLGIGAATAQSIEPVDWAGQVVIPADDSQHEYACDVQNIGDSEIQVRMKSTPITLASGSDYRFCWGIICYDWSTGVIESGTSNTLLVTMAPDEVNGSFYTDFRPHEVNGSSVIEYCWYDYNNASDEACFELEWLAGEVGIEETSKLEANISEVSPNPVTGTSSINYAIAGGFNKAQVQIYNLVGELVKDVQLNNPMGVLFFTADDFEAGIYLVNIMVDGNVFNTKKMVVSK